MSMAYKDPDMPTYWECKTFNTPLRKFLVIFLLPLFYSLRPLFVMPKKPNNFEILNIVAVLGVDFILWQNFGYQVVILLCLSTLVGIGPHPTAFHVIAEHYEFVNGLETASYYGILNIPNLNVGYHVEHHDFPQIPWTKLPKVREIAKEFYNYPALTSYIEVAVRYIFDKDIGPWSRIDRNPNLK